MKEWRGNHDVDASGHRRTDGSRRDRTVGRRRSCLSRRGARYGGAWGLVVGALLFAGDVSLPIFAGAGLFPKAAPTGGVILIVSWLASALAAVTPRAKTA